MPIFEFICDKCGWDFEKLVLSAGTKVVCPKCSSGGVSRKISSFATKTSAGMRSSAGGSGCQGCTSSNCGSCR